MRKISLLLSIFIIIHNILNSQTKEEVLCYIKKCKTKHDSVVLKQVLLETGYFTSYSCKVRKNLFGATNGKGTYLVFNTWQESVEWYKKWQDEYYKGDKGYYKFLNCVYSWKNECYSYAEDPEYTLKLKQIKI